MNRLATSGILGAIAIPTRNRLFTAGLLGATAIAPSSPAVTRRFIAYAPVSAPLFFCVKTRPFSPTDTMTGSSLL